MADTDKESLSAGVDYDCFLQSLGEGITEESTAEKARSTDKMIF